MGGYSTRTRTKRFRSHASDRDGNPSKRAPAPAEAEYVYSWRTGRNAQNDTGPGANAARDSGNFGIRSPRTTGSITDIVADRKRWANELDDTFGGVKNPNNQAECLVWSTTDTGHPFRSLKYNSLKVGTATMTYNGAAKPTYRFDMHAAPYAFAPLGWQELYNVFPFSTAVPGGQTGTLERQSKLNFLFSRAARQMPTAALGETIISLLRGEWPSILQSAFRASRALRVDLKGIANTAGQEYLTSVFAWKPLIQDIEKAINLLMTVDTLIFGTQYHEKQKMKWDSRFHTERTHGITTSHAYDPQFWGGVGSTIVPGLFGHKDMFEVTTVSKLDLRLSTRHTPAARPGIGSNNFISRAGEALNELGLWTPSLGWDLMPYSWLVDWAIHLGTSINNASYYGTQSLYPVDYAWATTVLRVDTQVNIPSMHYYNSGRGERWEFRGSPMSTSVAKYRESATPFGFGLDLSGLTSGQVAILVALGLARVR